MGTSSCPCNPFTFYQWSSLARKADIYLKPILRIIDGIKWAVYKLTSTQIDVITASIRADLHTFCPIINAYIQCIPSSVEADEK